MTEPSDATPPEEPAPEPAGGHVLRRSRDDRVIAGVAGGLGRHFGIDPLLLRIALVVLLLAGGTGALLYVVGWLVIPEEKEGDRLAPHTAPRTDLGGTPEIVGLGLIALGAFLLLRAVVPGLLDGRYVWPAVLIGIGVLVLLRSRRG